jgi:putative acetyltransferase
LNKPLIQLIMPSTESELGAAREIFREYAVELGVDLCFQSFDAELAGLPGDYAASRRAAAGLVEGEVAGCCALRPLDTWTTPTRPK